MNIYEDAKHMVLAGLGTRELVFYDFINFLVCNLDESRSDHF